MDIEQYQDYITVKLKVLPRSSKKQIAGEQNGRLKVKINSAPEGGKANKELIRFLAKKLKVSRTDIEVIKGETSPLKTIKIKGLSQEDFTKRIG